MSLSSVCNLLSLTTLFPFDVLATGVYLLDVILEVQVDIHVTGVRILDVILEVQVDIHVSVEFLSSEHCSPSPTSDSASRGFAHHLSCIISIGRIAAVCRIWFPLASHPRSPDNLRKLITALLAGAFRLHRQCLSPYDPLGHHIAAGEGHT